MEKGWEKNRKTSKTQEKRKEEENTLLSLMIEEDPAGVSFETPRGLTPECAEIHPMGRTQLRRELLTVFRIPSLRMLQPPFRKFSNPARQRTWPKSCEKQNKEEEDHAIDPSILLGCCFETPGGAWGNACWNFDSTWELPCLAITLNLNTKKERGQARVSPSVSSLLPFSFLFHLLRYTKNIKIDEDIQHYFRILLRRTSSTCCSMRLTGYAPLTVRTARS